MKRRRESFGLQPIGDLLRTSVDLRGAEAAELCPVSFRDWEGAVGSRIAARARPVRLDRGTLIVRAASSAWAQELTLLADSILEQLRARGLAVTALRFRIGQVEPPARPPDRTKVRHTPPLLPLPKQLQEQIAQIPDEELRASIARAASRSLGWAKLATSERQAARVPRFAASESALPDRSLPTPRGARPRKP